MVGCAALTPPYESDPRKARKLCSCFLMGIATLNPSYSLSSAADSVPAHAFFSPQRKATASPPGLRMNLAAQFPCCRWDDDLCVHQTKWLIRGRESSSSSWFMKRYLFALSTLARCASWCLAVRRFGYGGSRPDLRKRLTDRSRRLRPPSQPPPALRARGGAERRGGYGVGRYVRFDASPSNGEHS